MRSVAYSMQEVRIAVAAMHSPLLLLDHDWHAQRAKLRQGRVRPPPLVAAGLDVGYVQSQGRELKLGGLAVIFGTFPASLEEFVQMARLRLNLEPEQARELDPVLNTRILAMWAWLPTLRQDCYIEYDRATGDEHAWLIGPSSEYTELDLVGGHPDLDRAFLEGLVLNGPGHWGGAAGLERLVAKHGRLPLLIAAQVADVLEHRPREPRKALRLAQALWRDLTSDDESAWAHLVGSEHPWTCVQLGRLALRLGLLRAARLLLASAHAAADATPVAHFDLGQACEALDDLASAEAAFARFAAARPSDPDAWRRLLFCRLRMNHLQVAEETLNRYRNCGGKDAELAERWLTVVARGKLRLEQRALLAGWLGAHLHDAIANELVLEQLIDEIARLRFGGDADALAAACMRARGDLLLRLPDGNDADVEALLRTALLALPLIGLAHRDDAQVSADAIAAHLSFALTCWSELRMCGRLKLSLQPPWVRELAALAHAAQRHG